MAKNYPKLCKVLQKLLYDKRMNASELAREVGLPLPTVHRLATGKSTRPYLSSLKPIADYFSLNVEQLLGEEPLPNSTNKAVNVIESENHVIEIPLLEWPQLEEDLTRVKYNNTLVAAGELSAKCFAITMNDSSMAPYFEQGTFLIMDPEGEPYDRCYVLVKLAKNNLTIFRQLLIDADKQFLQSLNPELKSYKIRPLNADDTILAILVEARKMFGKN